MGKRLQKAHPAQHLVIDAMAVAKLMEAQLLGMRADPDGPDMVAAASALCRLLHQAVHQMDPPLPEG